MALVPFYKYPAEFWNSCYDILNEETKVLANPSDLCFLVDGYLFLIQDPATKANLILQSISKCLHPVSPIKHIYKLCLTLANHGIEYLHFSGKDSRYEVLYTRLFKDLLHDGTPDILRVYKEDSLTGYVVHLTPFVVEYCTSAIKDIPYYDVEYLDWFPL